jgi:lantibiotic modifying enzyme
VDAPAWRALFSGPERERILDLVEEIAAALSARVPDGFDLARGAAGEALLFAYLERARPDRGHGERALERLESAGDQLASIDAEPSLYHGVAGVAFVGEQLRVVLGLEADEEDNDDVDALLTEIVAAPRGDERFDLISGLAGIGWYACERLHRPSGRALAAAVLAALRTLSQERAGRAWRSRPEHLGEADRRLYPAGRWDLGVAHGGAGVIALLSRMHGAGLAARPLLDDAVAMVRANRLRGQDACYADFALPEGQPIAARTGWCYGDLGIAATLDDAGLVTGDPTWRADAAALLRGVIARRDTRHGIVDACLCHGATGLTLVMQRAWVRSGEDEFKAMAEAWARRTLAMRTPGRGVAGYTARAKDVDEEMGGFLLGAAGIGLGLLATASEEAPGWTRALALL